MDLSDLKIQMMVYVGRISLNKARPLRQTPRLFLLGLAISNP